MKKVSFKKAGISMVALVITIIVMLVLTSAVVIIGVNITDKAKLTVIYNNIDTVQDAVTMKVLDNSLEHAGKKQAIYKWIGVAEGYTVEDANNDADARLEESTIAFEKKILGLDIDVIGIDNEVMGKITIPEDEKSKYYVDKQGIVYYEGVTYNGEIHYNQNTTVAKAIDSIEVTKQPNKTVYEVGENFDASGMEVTVTYNDGQQEKVTNYVIVNGQNIQAETRQIVIRYTEQGVTKETSVNISLEGIQEINVEYTFTNHNTYLWTLEQYNNATVLKSGNGGVHNSSAPFTFAITPGADCSVEFEYTVSSERSYDLLQINNQTIASGSSSATYTVNVEGGKQTSIPVTYSKDGSANSGEDCVYIRGISIKNINSTYSVNLEELLNNGNGETKLIQAELRSIEIFTPPTKVVYETAEKFSTSGMVVKANYADRTSQEITTYTCTPDTNTALTTVTPKIFISYTEGVITKTATQDIMVMDISVNGKMASDMVQTTNVSYGIGNTVLESKYYWTTATTDLTASQLSSSGLTFASGTNIPIPTTIGDWYLWIYVKDTKGNVYIKKTKIFHVDITIKSAATTFSGSTVSITPIVTAPGNIELLKYMWTTSTTQPSDLKTNGTDFTSGTQITNNSASATTKLWVYVKDSYGNEKIAYLGIGANPPVLASGMKAVYWDALGNEIDSSNPAFDSSQWYDYSKTTDAFQTEYTGSKWANAKTEDGSYWVWIPRFAYNIVSNYHTATPGQIDIDFLQGTTDVGESGRTTWDNVSGQGKWNVHPAFYYTDSAGTTTQIPGFWIMKYMGSQEFSSNSGSTWSASNVIGVLTKAAGNTDYYRLVSKPGRAPWEQQRTFNAQYLSALHMSAGLGMSTSNAQSHLIKNMEYAAASYLAHSSYGRNGRVDWFTITPYSGGATTENGVVNVEYSSTGNRYGIFDWGYNHTTTVYSTSGTPTGWTELANADAKYKEIYTATYGSEPYGAAMYETSATNGSHGAGGTSWYGGTQGFTCNGDSRCHSLLRHSCFAYHHSHCAGESAGYGVPGFGYTRATMWVY